MNFNSRWILSINKEVNRIKIGKIAYLYYSTDDSNLSNLEEEILYV
jgi:hypothetical protein